MDKFNLKKYLSEGKLLKEDREEQYVDPFDNPDFYDGEGNMKDEYYKEEFGFSFKEKQNWEKILDQVKKQNNFDVFDAKSLRNYDKIEDEANQIYTQKYGSPFLKENKLVKEDLADRAFELEMDFMDPSNKYGDEWQEEVSSVLLDKYEGKWGNWASNNPKELEMLLDKFKNLAEGKLIKENSTYPSVDSNVAYLVDQIYDDMMYTEFDSKEDVDKFIDSIIDGINKLRDDVKKNWDEANTEPDFMDPDFDPNLEEGKLVKENQYTEFIDDGDNQYMEFNFDEVEAYVSAKKGEEFARDFSVGDNGDFNKSAMIFFEKNPNPTDAEALNFIDKEIDKARFYLYAPGGRGLREDDLEEGRHYYGAGMDDEYDEPRYSRGRRSSYKDALMNPPTPSGNQDEEEFDEEDIEFVKGKDYNAQNQKVLNRMDESNFNQTLKKASKKLKENKLKKINKRK